MSQDLTLAAVWSGAPDDGFHHPNRNENLVADLCDWLHATVLDPPIDGPDIDRVALGRQIVGELLRRDVIKWVRLQMLNHLALVIHACNAVRGTRVSRPNFTQGSAPWRTAS